MSVSRVHDKSSNSGSESHSLISQPSGERPTPDRNARMESFSLYPPPHYVNVLHLAKHGFMYDATSEEGRVYCVECKKVKNSWRQGDQPYNPEFHEAECRFARPETPSSGSITDMSENFLRASVQSGEESTKPLETAERSELSNLPHGGMHSYMPSSSSQVPARQAFSVPPRINRELNITPPGHFSIARIRQSSGGGSRTSEMELLHAQHHPYSGSFSHRSLSPAPSMPSYSASASTYHGSQSGTFSNLTFPPQDIRESHHSSPSRSAFERTRHHSRPETSIQPLDIINSLEMRVAENRLYTFEQFWSEDNEFRNFRLLVVCGFFCIGQGDAVECFCCHVVIANWSRNDNPRTRHIQMSPYCRFMKDEECGDVPLAVERRRPSRLRPSQSLPSSSMQTRRSSRHTSPYPGHRSPNQSIITQPSVEGPIGPETSPVSSIQGAVGPVPGGHLSPHSSMGAPTAERYSHPTNEMVQRSNLMTHFPCFNPANASMREERARLRTFLNGEFRRRTRLLAPTDTLVKAGFYYAGHGDRVKCWFCDGGLQEFLPEDDPWVEHAKYYPECDYLLQQKGPGWIENISVQNPGINRPILPRREPQVLPQVVSSPTPLPPPPARIEDPNQLEQYRNQLLAEGMQSEPAQRAREMGYSEDRIRNAQWQKILLDDCCYQTTESLINALTPDHQPDSPPGESSPQIPVTEMPQHDQLNFQGNVLGGAFFNGQYYPPSTNGHNVRYSSTTFNSQPGTGLFINGQSMQEYMANAFDHPFFRGEMDHLMTGMSHSSTTVVNPNPIVHHHHHVVRPVIPQQPPRPQAPTASPQTSARTVPPPPRPPLQAISIPRRSAPRSSSAAVSSNTTTTVSGAAASTTSVTTSGATTSSAQTRLEELERERTCKICLNAQSVILFQPCGHICACESCARQVNSCPVCRRRIERNIRTYPA